MDWRCEWCGKPHEENDPPCDNCGHGSFEKAVVRQTDPTEESGPETTTVWVCSECGRNHPKHAPPCSRCGNHKLVQEEQRVDDAELDVPGYLDLVTPKYLAALAAVLLVGGVLVLGILGVVNIPGFGNGVPQVSDVPGDATHAGDVPLDEAEQRYVTRVNEDRTAPALTREERLDEVARYVVQKRVKAEYGDGEAATQNDVQQFVGNACSGEPFAATAWTTQTEFESADALGESLARTSATAAAADVDDLERIGVDLHTAPDGTVYVSQVVC